VAISSTFHTHFFANILAPKNFKPKTKLCNFWHKISAQNARVKMLIKLTSGVNFINVFCVRFSYEFLAQNYVSAWRQKFVQKTRAKNVDEIDCRWHYLAVIRDSFFVRECGQIALFSSRNVRLCIPIR